MKLQLRVKLVVLNLQINFKNIKCGSKPALKGLKEKEQDAVEHEDEEKKKMRKKKNKNKKNKNNKKSKKKIKMGKKEEQIKKK